VIRLRALAALLLALTLLAGCSDETDAPAATRTVEHALGATAVPAEPERIVALNEYAILDALVALEAPPVAATGRQGKGFPFGAWLEGRTEGVELICCSTEPNLEQIATHEPDLILANPWQEDIYAELSKIAPTVGVPLTYVDYEQEVRDIAEIIGRPEAADEAIARHRERLERFSAAVGKGPGLISVARVFPDSIRVEGESYVPTLLANAGLERPAAHGKDLELSVERLPAIDGDVLFVYSADNPQEAERNARARERLARHPLWRSLKAVRAGRAYTVDSALWAGGGILWADAMLDDLERHLLPDGT